MLIAMPLFGVEIAPRFCFTSQMLIVSLEGGREIQRDTIDVVGLQWWERLNLLTEHSAKMLICGGFNRRFLPYAKERGLQVCWGYYGPADEILTKLAAIQKSGDLQDLQGPKQTSSRIGHHRRGRCWREGHAPKRRES